MFSLGKVSLIITTRCNLHCKLCCEYVPQNDPFEDMKIEEEQRILERLFETVDHIDTLHLTGGGEPFLHRQLAEMIEIAMEYGKQFDRLMLFSNSTIPIEEGLLGTMKKYRDRILVQLSQYRLQTEREQGIHRLLEQNKIACKVVRYYGEHQDFGGWVDFGAWEAQNCEEDVLSERFENCAVTKAMHGNWRTRDGKLHWCSRSQRGMELGLIPDRSEDYVDLFDENEGREEKQKKFSSIAKRKFLSACDYCSGDQGTADRSRRYPAAEQL